MNKNIPLILDYLSARGRTEDLRLFYKDKPTIREERLSVVSLKTKFSHQIFASVQHGGEIQGTASSLRM